MPREKERGRTRITSWQIIAQQLHSYWRKKYTQGKQKWNIVPGQSGIEGHCSATITLTSGVNINGSYEVNSYHAEMDALHKVIDMDDIAKINISSPPCSKCAVVLEIFDLSGKVYCKNFLSKNCPSSNWPSNNKKQLVDIVAHFLDVSERQHYENDIFSFFQAVELS